MAKPLQQEHGFRTLIRIELLVVLVYVLLKASRSWNVSQVDNVTLRIILYSFPNLAEAIVGVITVSCVLLLILRRYFKRSSPKDATIYLLSVVFSAVYVITQELEWHNLGGNNDYDPYDVLFSGIGLLCGYLIVRTIAPRVSIPQPDGA